MVQASFIAQGLGGFLQGFSKGFAQHTTQQRESKEKAKLAQTRAGNELFQEKIFGDNPDPVFRDAILQAPDVEAQFNKNYGKEQGPLFLQAARVMQARDQKVQKDIQTFVGQALFTKLGKEQLTPQEKQLVSATESITGAQAPGTPIRREGPSRRLIRDPDSAEVAQERISRRAQVQEAGALAKGRQKTERAKELLQTFEEQQEVSQTPSQGLAPARQVRQSTTISEDGVSIRFGPESTPAQRGAAFVLQTIDQNPAQFDEALRQLADQGIVISPEQHKVLSGAATSELILQNMQTILQQNPQISQVDLNRQSLLMTSEQMSGKFSRDVVKDIQQAISNPAISAAAIRAAQNTADSLSTISSLGQQSAGVEAEQAATQAGLVTEAQEQARRVVQQNDPVSLETARAFSLPSNTTVGQFRNMRLNAISEGVIKRAENDQATLVVVSELRSLFLLGKPFKNSVEARLKGFAKNFSGSLGFDPAVSIYNDAKEAFLAALAAAGGETTRRYTDQDIERARQLMPTYGLSEAEGLKRFKLIEDIIVGAFKSAAKQRGILTGQTITPKKKKNNLRVVPKVDKSIFDRE